MGDYLRLILTNRGGEQFDFETSKENLSKTIEKMFLSLRERKISSTDSNSTTYVFMETGSAPYRIEKKFRLPLVLFTWDAPWRSPICSIRPAPAKLPRRL